MSAPIFISHSSKDIKISRTICSALEHRGLHCWIAERDVDGGQNYQEAIVRAIRAAKIMVLVFTSSANTSSEIKKELSLASKYGLTVVPIRTEDVIPSEAFELELATRQWIDMFAGWEEALERLAGTIRRALPAEASPGAEGAARESSPPRQGTYDAERPAADSADPERFVSPLDRWNALAANDSTARGHLRLAHIGAALMAVNAVKVGLWVLMAAQADAMVDISPEFIYENADLPAILLLIAGFLLHRRDSQGARIFTGISAAIYAFWHFHQVGYLLGCLDVHCVAYAGNGFDDADGVAGFLLLLANVGLCGGAIVTMFMTRAGPPGSGSLYAAPYANAASSTAPPRQAPHPQAAYPQAATGAAPARAAGEYHWTSWLIWAVGAVISFFVMSYVREMFP